MGAIEIVLIVVCSLIVGGVVINSLVSKKKKKSPCSSCSYCSSCHNCKKH